MASALPEHPLALQALGGLLRLPARHPAPGGRQPHSPGGADDRAPRRCPGAGCPDPPQPRAHRHPARQPVAGVVALGHRSHSHRHGRADACAAGWKSTVDGPPGHSAAPGSGGASLVDERSLRTGDPPTTASDGRPGAAGRPGRSGPCRCPRSGGHRRWPGTVAPAHRTAGICDQRGAGVVAAAAQPRSSPGGAGPGRFATAWCEVATALPLRGRPDP